MPTPERIHESPSREGAGGQCSLDGVLVIAEHPDQGGVTGGPALGGVAAA